MVVVVSLDLSAALDSISHALLLRKLQAYGMSIGALELMKSYLSDRYNHVKVNGVLSTCSFKMIRGIPQGSQWGPLIWNVFINDLLPMITKCGADVFAYADDVTFWIVGDNVYEIQTKLDTTMTAILDWFSKNNLIPNPDKFQCQCLGAQKEYISLSNAGGICLENKDCITLLGLRIDREFKFDKQIKYLSRIIAWKLTGIRRLKNSVSRAVRWKLVQTYILPHFEYMSIFHTFLSSPCKKKLQAMHNRCLRIAARDIKAPISSLTAMFNAPELELRWCIALFRTMQSIWRTTITSESINPREFLENYQFLKVYAPLSLAEHFRSCDQSRMRRNVFVQPKVRTVKYGQNSLRFYGTSFWKQVPSNIRKLSPRSETVRTYLLSYIRKKSGIT